MVCFNLCVKIEIQLDKVQTQGFLIQRCEMPLRFKPHYRRKNPAPEILRTNKALLETLSNVKWTAFDP